MRKQRDEDKLSKDERNRLSEQYRDVYSNPAWVFVRNATRIIRPYSTKDFTREPFIPDL